MRRKALPLIAVLTLAAAACGGPGVEVRSGPTEEVFVPQVVEFEGNVGSGVSLATDADGNPHLAYLAFEEEPQDGETPAQEDPAAPKLPAVRHAHLVDNVWTRSEVVSDQKELTEEDQAAIAVDSEGIHHVAWTAGGTLFYANNSEGAEFSKPEEVTANVAGGLSIAAGEDGAPRIAFVEETGAEGPGALVRVATRAEAGWTVETAAEASAQETPSTAVAVGGQEVLVGFGDSGGTMLARSGQPWRSETADRDGGTGISMDVDADGNPHVAYATSDGQVKHAHSIGGGPWEVNEVGADADGTTSIAVDQEGVHHVAWQTSQGISYASNAEGDFQTEELAGSEGGATPRVGAGSEGTVYLAWYDTEGSELVMAVRSDREPLLAVPPPASPTGQPTGPPTGPPPCEPSGTSLAIAAPPGAAGSGFAEDCLAAPAGEAFTIDFTNDDSGVPHNVGIYESQGGQPFFQGEIITAPDQVTYDVESIDEAGQYHFQCDVHPTTMTGTFVVQ